MLRRWRDLGLLGRRTFDEALQHLKVLPNKHRGGRTRSPAAERAAGASDRAGLAQPGPRGRASRAVRARAADGRALGCMGLRLGQSWRRVPPAARIGMVMRKCARRMAVDDLHVPPWAATNSRTTERPIRCPYRGICAARPV